MVLRGPQAVSGREPGSASCNPSVLCLVLSLQPPKNLSKGASSKHSSVLGGPCTSIYQQEGRAGNQPLTQATFGFRAPNAPFLATTTDASQNICAELGRPEAFSLRRSRPCWREAHVWRSGFMLFFGKENSSLWFLYLGRKFGG